MKRTTYPCQATDNAAVEEAVLVLGDATKAAGPRTSRKAGDDSYILLKRVMINFVMLYIKM